jgi:uncharacterized phage protein gp47/JayE
MALEDYGIKENGFIRPTKEALLQEFKDKVIEQLPQIDISSGSIFDIIFNLNNDFLDKILQTIEEFYFQSRIETATGINLDNLIAISGMQRKYASSSSVFCIIKGINGTSIPIGTQISNPATNDYFLNLTEGLISIFSCVELEISFNNVLPDTLYKFLINDISTSYTSASVIVLADFIDDIIQTINNNVNYLVVATKIDTNKIKITAENLKNTFSFVASNNITINDVSSLLNFYAQENGQINVNANSITNIISSINGFKEVYNAFEGSIGTLEEADEELRDRFFLIGKNNRAYATSSAIVNAFNNVDLITGISYLKLLEQPTDVDYVKLIHLIVEGGTDIEVAELLFSQKPAGVGTFGNTQIEVKDLNGDTQFINFTRPQKKYVWLKATLTQGGDFTIPSNYSELAKELILKQAEKIINGVDIIPLQFAGTLALNVAGVEDVLIEIAITDTENGTPSYTANRITILDTQYAVFDASRLTITIA